ncbi:hypothetical protein L873DRAFT_15328 [Choiromyces venosus 120613-1]|uniref:Copper transporter n=1 Tax=Choiromyces venosus 120613-1 TaxID=1336337 RepID=A0A3N4K999_9PEZI|nr:hypothetical protein L873DRAFT_15328 [Choiromyces venosus 120613-1]
MRPFAFIFAVLFTGIITAGYPLDAKAVIPRSSPSYNSNIRRMSTSATPTPSEPFLPGEELSDTSKNLPPDDPPDQVVGSEDAIQKLDIQLDDVPQNNLTSICTQSSQSDHSATAFKALHGFLQSVWDIGPASQIPIIWLFFGWILLATLGGMRYALRVVLEMRAGWSRRNSSKKSCEEKQLRESLCWETLERGSKPSSLASFTLFYIITNF